MEINIMAEKKFSLRVELELEAVTDGEAIKLSEIIIKELPKMNGLRYIKSSLFNKQARKVIKED